MGETRKEGHAHLWFIGDTFPTEPVVHHEGFVNKDGVIKKWAEVTADLGKYLVVTLPGAFTPT